MGPRAAAAIILLGVSGIVWLIGYLIGSHKQLAVIARRDGPRVRDGEGLARWIRGGLLKIGVLDLLISLMLFATPVDTALVIVAHGTASLVGAAVLLTGVRDYLG